MARKKTFLNLSKVNLLILSIVLVLITLSPKDLMALETVNEPIYSKLEYKIAKGYSNKFCNAIGIGVSIEGALRMTVSENREASFNPSLWLDLALNRDEEINDFDKDSLTSLVSSEVVDKCGYPIGLAGEDGEKYFEEIFKEAMNSDHS